MSESRSESDNNNNNRSNISSTANSNTIESKPKSESLALESESKKRKSFASSPSSSMSNSLEQKQKIPNVVSTNDQQKQLSETITKLFTQLTKGCGRINCRNERCCSNLLIDPLPVNEAAAKAVLLAPSAIERHYLCSDSNVVSMSTPDELLQLATEAARDNNVVPLIRKIGVVFGNWHSLVLSFHPRLDDDLDVKKLSEFYSIVNALERPKHVLKSSLERLLADFKYALPPINSPILDKALEIIEKHPQAFESTDEGLLASFGAALLHLQPKPKQALIARWSSYDSDHLKQWLGKMNGALDLLIMREMELPEPKSINELAGVQAIVGVLAILNVINKNRIDDVERLESVVDLEADRLLMEHIENRKSTTSTTLSTTTTVAATPHAAPSVALSKKPFATFQEFQNGLIEEMLDLSLDFTNNIRGVGFSLTAHPFLLETGLKAKVLRLKSMVAQRQEGINAVRALHSGLSNAQPVLAIKVRRANIVEDTFRELQRVSAKDLRKELRVTFEQEEAVDEGGVRKEWFQLLIREIFDPKYGMFVYNETTRHYWFRRDSPERLFYNLMGSLLGMAIYNGVVLDVHFPSIVYKLLLGERALLSDLAEIDAELHRGLQQLLNFDGDVEDVYDRTFEVEYEEFGVAKKAELIKGGSELALTNDNRHDYVRLYAKHMLLDSVREQWAAFRRGFELVCERSTMDGFVWQELELLIAGSPLLDFHALERAARYSDRYDADHATIRRFWTVVHSLDVDQQRQLLHFTTGSDRAPIGGLGKLKLGIVYQPDSDRLPTSHTCFNQLILPDYPTEEKMREKLLAAIANAEGFGMI